MPSSSTQYYVSRYDVQSSRECAQESAPPGTPLVSALGRASAAVPAHFHVKRQVPEAS